MVLGSEVISVTLHFKLGNKYMFHTIQYNHYQGKSQAKHQ